MKKKLFFIVAIAALASFPKIIFGQAPNLGSAANYVLFTSSGAVGNTGVSQVTGNVGTNVGAITAFGNVNGVLNIANASSSVCATDLLTAYNQLNATPATTAHAAVLGGGEILTAGVYSIAAAGSAVGTLSLDAQSNPSAIFIFKIGGAFTTAASTKIVLINGALACNVFWKVEGAIAMAAGTSMKGTLIANNAAISMAAGGTLEGRMFSTSGAVAIDGSSVSTPIGCGSPVLMGPTAPNLASALCYALFSSSGAVTNTGLTNVTGDVGTNVGLTSGFTATNVIGTIHSTPDASTSSCANDLLNAYNYLNSLPFDIELLYPAQLGNKLVLTPHTYTLNMATVLSDTLYLNAQNNSGAIFVISINGALTTSVGAKVILINGAQAKNVFWVVKGNVSINNNSNFIGTIVCNNGTIDLGTGSNLSGNAFTTSGALTTNSITAIKQSTCSITDIPAYNIENTNETISIYPNPFNSSLNINLNNVTNFDTAELNIYNIVGELLLTKLLTKQLSKVDTSNFPTGFYFYKVVSKNKIIQSGRLISQQ